MIKEAAKFLQKEVDAGRIPGAVLSISHKGTVVQEVVGNRRVDMGNAQMKLDTIFDLASLTKVIATLPAVLKLIDAKIIGLDERIDKYLPEFQQVNNRKLTIRQLLSHTSGLPAFRPFHSEGVSKKRVLQEIGATSLVSPPGRSVTYSDLGFIALYKAVEAVVGMNFAEFVDREIFYPLKMTSTRFCPTSATGEYAPTEYDKKLKAYKERVVHDENAELLGGVSGHAGLFSTIDDIEKFAYMIENRGTFEGKTILKEDSIELSQKNFSPAGCEPRGLGWALNSQLNATCGKLFSTKAYGHTGFTGTSLWFDPVVDLHVVLLTNRVHISRDPATIRRIRLQVHTLIRSSL